MNYLRTQMLKRRTQANPFGNSCSCAFLLKLLKFNHIHEKKHPVRCFLKRKRMGVFLLPLTLSFVLLAGCALWQSEKQNAFSAERQNLLAQEEQELKQLKTNLKTKTSGSFDLKETLALIDKNAKLGSPFYNEWLFLKALAFEKNGDCERALEQYKKLSDYRFSNNERIKAQATYRQAFCYEEQGQDVQALSLLLSLVEQKQHLDAELALAELPARISATYTRLGEEQEAQNYLIQAEQGITQLIDRNNDKEEQKRWLSYTFLQMGTLSVGQIHWTNFQKLQQAWSETQKYLVRSIELNDPTWSAKAEQELVQTYERFWNYIYHFNPASTFDWQTDLYQKAKAQKQLALYLKRSLDTLELALPIEKENLSPKLKTTVTYVENLASRLDNKIYSKELLLPETPEAQRLENIRIDGLNFIDPNLNLDSY